MDWELCVVCQQPSNESLKCPLNGPGSADKSGPYQSFLSRVCTFRTLDVLPMPLSHFTEQITVDDMVSNEAKWHKSCHNKFGHDRLDRARKRKRAEMEVESSNISNARRVCPRRQLPDKSKCIFCEEDGDKLHQFSTLQSDTSVQSMARDLQDVSLLSKIEGGDLIALEAKYHLSCLVKLCNRHRSYLREIQNASSKYHEERKKEARAFVELLTYIEGSVEEGKNFFKFSELRFLYESRLKDFGISKEVNKVRFKEQILSHYPEAQAQSDGKNIILVFEKGMQQILKQAYNCNYEDDALVLSKAAKIVREDILNSNGFQFSGSFPPNCQQDSVPTNLTYLVSMLLNGSGIKDQDSKTTSQHSKKFEPPLPLYIGLKVHTQTRSKKLISELYQLGLSVSYDRILELEKQIASFFHLRAHK